MRVFVIALVVFAGGCSSFYWTPEHVSGFDENQLCGSIRAMKEFGVLAGPAENGVLARAELKKRGFTDSEYQAIIKSQIVIGMSQRALTCSWGPADDENKTVGSWGVHTQHIYMVGDIDRNYVYTENGVITSWQN